MEATGTSVKIERKLYLPEAFTDSDAKGKLKDDAQWPRVKELANDALFKTFHNVQGKNEENFYCYYGEKIELPEVCNAVNELLKERGIQATCKNDGSHRHYINMEPDNQSLLPPPKSLLPWLIEDRSEEKHRTALGLHQHRQRENEFAKQDLTANLQRQKSGILKSCKVVFANGKERCFLAGNLAAASPRMARALEKGNCIQLPKVVLTEAIGQWFDYIVGYAPTPPIPGINEQVQLGRFAAQYQFSYLAEICVREIWNGPLTAEFKRCYWYDNRLCLQLKYEELEVFSKVPSSFSSKLPFSTKEVIQLALLADDLEHNNLMSRTLSDKEVPVKLTLKPRLEHWLLMNPNFHELVAYKAKTLTVNEDLIRLYRIALGYQPPAIAEAILKRLADGVSRDSFTILVRFAVELEGRPYYLLTEALQKFMSSKGSDGESNSIWLEKQSLDAKLRMAKAKKAIVGIPDGALEIEPIIIAKNQWSNIETSLLTTQSWRKLEGNLSQINDLKIDEELLSLYSMVIAANGPAEIATALLNQMIRGITQKTFVMLAQFALKTKDPKTQLTPHLQLSHAIQTFVDSSSLYADHIDAKKDNLGKAEAQRNSDPRLVPWKVWKELRRALDQGSLPNATPQPAVVSDPQRHFVQEPQVDVTP